VIVYKFLSALSEPLCFGFLLLLVIVFWQIRRRAGRGYRWRVLLIFSYLFWLSTTEFFARPVLGTLENQYPRLTKLEEKPSAIVVFSGGMVGDPETGKCNLRFASIERIAHAARVWREYGPCPIIVSGGPIGLSIGIKASLAEVMRDYLVDMGIPKSDIILEDRALTTYQNSIYSAEIIRQRGFDPNRVVLVTGASHMWRSILSMQKQGIAPTAAPCGFEVKPMSFSLNRFLPSRDGVCYVHMGVHEWVGLLYYWATGKI
jgi:uncharacterized SAM-binding protein YcdF (DUF218 family)